LSAFAALDWRRIDVTAIVTFSGVGTIDERRHMACREWLLGHGYAIDTLDCRLGLAVAIPELGRRLCWEQQFGYALGPESRNLDALRDGFHFTIPEGGGQVLEILGAEPGWREDPRWFCGLLSIAQEQSRRQLALGRRFFVLLVIPERSPLIGEVVGQMTVPGPFWSPCREVHEFVR
jgi:hypothetical protein